MATDPFTLDFGRDKYFCTYIWRDPRRGQRREPIYVGKGVTKTRPNTRKECNILLDRVVAKIRKAGLEPIIEYVAFFDDAAPALALEIELIKRIGRRDLKTGPLCNLTAGGEGLLDPSPQVREAISKAKKGIRPVRPDNDRWITANGEKKQLLDWARALGCHPAAIIRRVKNQGMTWEEAVTTPILNGKGAYQVTLSREQGAEIIRRYIGGETQPTLAKAFSVDSKTIFNVLHGNRFPELPRDFDAIAKAAEAGRHSHAGSGLLLTVNGETHNVKEWSKLVGLHVNVIRERKRRGLSDADALAHVNASGEHNRRISPSEYPEIARLHAAGEGATLISRRYGVAKSTITVALRKMRALSEAAE